VQPVGLEFIMTPPVEVRNAIIKRKGYELLLPRTIQGA
jgi:hypothetical protein